MSIFSIFRLAYRQKKYRHLITVTEKNISAMNLDAVKIMEYQQMLLGNRAQKKKNREKRKGIVDTFISQLQSNESKYIQSKVDGQEIEV